VREQRLGSSGCVGSDKRPDGDAAVPARKIADVDGGLPTWCALSCCFVGEFGGCNARTWAAALRPLCALRNGNPKLQLPFFFVSQMSLT